MKNTFLLTIVIVVLLFASSCAPVYRCGDAVPAKKGLATKRMKKVVAERDSLCTSLSQSNNENAGLRSELRQRNNEIDGLKKDINQLNAAKSDLQGRYDQLMNDKIADAAKFDKSLKQKADELTEKERLLAEREKSLRELQRMIARQDSITARLNDIIRNALLGFKADELSVEIKNGKVYVSMSDKLLFKSGSAAVEAKGKEAIGILGGVLTKNPDIDVLIEGHTDNVPIRTAVFRDNWDLSVARATSIVRILTDDYKVPPTRLTASGKGEFMPRESNETAEGRARNRRTEIILSPKLDELMKLLSK
jgi:chemotaxis protein MotB